MTACLSVGTVRLVQHALYQQPCSYVSHDLLAATVKREPLVGCGPDGRLSGLQTDLERSGLDGTERWCKFSANYNDTGGPPGYTIPVGTPQTMERVPGPGFQAEL